MPPAGEPTLASPDIRPLRPHYPCLEGLRTIGVMALFFQHTGYTTGLQMREGFSWMGHLELGYRGGRIHVLGSLGAPSRAALLDRPDQVAAHLGRRADRPEQLVERARGACQRVQPHEL